jgi:hypothetical protein
MAVGVIQSIRRLGVEYGKCGHSRKLCIRRHLVLESFFLKSLGLSPDFPVYS